MDRFWSAPPVSRTLTALTCIQSALVYGGLLSGIRVLFLPELLVKLPPEVWRPFTSFLLTGPRLDFLFDLYFLFTYSSSLEAGSPRFSAPGDFVTYVFFVATVIVLTAGCLLNSVIFTHALILAFIYTFAQDNRGRKATFFVVQIPIEFLPWATLAFTLVRSGWPAALSDSMGVVAAHLYDFLTRIYPTFGGGRNYLTTPACVRRLFATGEHRGEYRAYGTAYRPGGQPSTAAPSSSGSGWSSAFQSPWSSRGPGRRLG